MASVFTRTNEYVDNVNRNLFDLSFQNNLTMQFGYLYPVFLKEALPGDSFDIRPTFALNFMPMVFPVQTRMNANLHFFFVRKRNLWSDFMDFFGKTKPNLIAPYINFNTKEKLRKMASTGSLGDYLGLPTTHVGTYGAEKSYNHQYWAPNAKPAVYRLVGRFQSLRGNGPSYYDVSTDFALNLFNSERAKADTSTNEKLNKFYNEFMKDVPFVSPFVIDLSEVKRDLKVEYKLTGVSKELYTSLTADTGRTLKDSLSFVLYRDNKALKVYGKNEISGRPGFPHDTLQYEIKDVMDVAGTSGSRVSFTILLHIKYADEFANTNRVGLVFPPDFDSFFFTKSPITTATNFTNFFNIPSTSSVHIKVKEVTEGVRDIDLNSSPYYNSESAKKDKQLKISAEPFRAYESIYNAFYRDIRNNPYMLNGVAEYNKYIPSADGGVDNHTYELRRRNWEQDFLTTAVQSPTAGDNPPLVGLTTLHGESIITLTGDDGKVYEVKPTISQDGEMLASVDVSESTRGQLGTPRSLIDLATSGISITDLRNVNAYQRWLEVNVRKGMRFKDIIKGHYDVNVRFDELNMPEFIGGTSQEVYVNQISQTTERASDGSYGGALGSYAGQASCVGTSKNEIRHYVDEPGYIIGILSVSPVPNYSQLLPKHFLKRETLDTYFPEFGHISMQPILYDEVCPIQAYNDNPDSLRDTFGYQRAWYDYLASTDEVHGLFRTNLRNFLINRVFNTKPALSPSFLLIDPEQVNDVFSVTETTDKILGQVYFDCKVKRPIPVYGIPRLE